MFKYINLYRICILTRYVCAFIMGMTVCTPVYGQLWQTYPHAVINLGDLGDEANVWAYGISESGDVVGDALLTTGYFHAYLWSNGKMLDLGDLGGGFSTGRDVNSLGQVAGESHNANLDEHAFFWENGIMIDLGTFGGPESVANGINDSGQVVGSSETTETGQEGQAFIWEGGDLIGLPELEPPGDSRGSTAYDISSRGYVSGVATLGPERHAVMWDQNRQIIDLGAGGGTDAWGYAINDLGQVVGQYNRGEPHYDSHAFFTDGTEWIDLNMEGPWYDGDASSANGINNQGYVVGWVGYNAINPQAFLWHKDFGRILLKEIAPPLLKWARLVAARDINELNQITGHANYYRDMPWYESQAFLMTPVYPSFDLTEATPGIAGEVNTIKATNVQPGTKVYFVWGNHGGGAQIPGCDITINALQIEKPKIAGTATADTSGTATLTGNIPRKYAGQWLLFQAVIPQQCEISNLIVQKLE